jgi:antitoxin HicB
LKVQIKNDLMKIPYPIVIYPLDESGYVAEVPALNGCLAQGETLTETLAELEIVTTLWLETASKHQQSLPDIAQALNQVKRLSA